MRPETRLGAGIAATFLLTAASLVVHLDDRSSQAAVPSVSTDGQMVLIARGCTACHTTADVQGGSVGPNLSDLADRAAERVPGLDAEAYIRQSIQDPQAFRAPGFEHLHMPTLLLTDAELDAVVAYLLEG